MMASMNDQFELLFNNFQAAFSPLQSNFRKAAKNLEHCVNAKNHSRKRGEITINVFEGKFAGKCGSDLNLLITRLRFDLALSFLIDGFEKLGMSKRDRFCSNGGVKMKKGAGFSFEFVFDHECNDNGYKALGMNGFFEPLNFARVGGLPSGLIDYSECKSVDREESGGDSPEKLPSIPLSVIQKESTDSVLKSALAGGISCAFSTFLMHPIDTVKTQVQASTLSFTEILAKLPQLGARGLYMGSIPAIAGQFASHALRTGICESTKVVLINVAPSLPEIQVESLGSFLGTFLGTTMRIPCEVLKQRLQAGQYNHVGEALVGTWQQDGLGGFFRGTGMTLCRELPFYVAGSSLYAGSKKAVQRIIGRELQPWETIAVGAVSGGLTAVLTTPFDVIKTRMMIALQGQPTTMSVVAISILSDEGLLGLFRGAVPRFFWVAPLGAINFAGYELLRKAMD